MKNDRQLEQIVRGFSNHKRLAILRLLAKHAGLSAADISKAVRCNYQTTAAHIRRLHQAGLIHKSQPGQAQHHQISDRGRAVLSFLTRLQ